jgi:uncharacterized membrane protein
VAHVQPQTSLSSKLIHGLPGHPLHPPLTDVTIGMFVLASALGIIGVAGGLGDTAGKAMWLALVGGLIAAVPTALTGLADWLTLEWGSRRWRTATFHLLLVVTAVVLFALAAWLQWSGWQNGTVTTGGLIVTLVGAGALLAGGWFGGAVVFVHGTRVLELEETAPLPTSAPGGDLVSRGHAAVEGRRR